MKLNKDSKLDLGFRDSHNSYYMFLELNEISSLYLLISNSNTLYLSPTTSCDHYSLELLQEASIEDVKEFISVFTKER